MINSLKNNCIFVKKYIMDKKEIIEYIITDNVGGRKSKEKHFKNFLNKNYLEINDFNYKHYSALKLEWRQKLYNYLYDIKEIPICKNPNCSKTVNYYFSKNRYYDYCSVKCQTSDKVMIEKRKTTTKERYGVDNPMQCAEIRKKALATNKERYGFEDITKSPEIQKKIRATCQTKYGTDHPVQSKEIKEKIQKTNLERYGVACTLSDEKTKAKIVETNLKKYGFDNPMKSDRVKEKLNKTNLEKYDCIRYVLSDDYKKIMEDENKKTTAKIYSEKLNITPDSIIVEDEYLRISNYCSIHSEFIISKGNLCNRLAYGVTNICTECNPISDTTSIKEKEIKNFIEDELKIQTQKTKIENKEIDIYLPEHKIGIEFDGIYWHSNAYKETNYHLNKTELCERNDIMLIHIFEDEWLLKSDIVKSIIKSKLGVIDNKIFARKCEIKEIDAKTCTEFLIHNHIQGNVNSLIKLGLYYDNELVSVMTFGHLRNVLGNNKIKNNNEYEMLRFCNKLDTQVIGGAGKLLNYFIKTYNPKSIISFADRRYSNGKLYEKLGFKFIENTVPNYWYIKRTGLNREHRFKYRKDVLVKEGFDPNKSEHEIMNERGYLRIYDCGSMKFEYKITN
jgi:hypothetical protein